MCKFLQPSPNPARRLPPSSIVRERECKLVVCVTSFHATQPLVITASVHRSCLIPAVSQYIRSCPFVLSPQHANVLQWRTTSVCTSASVFLSFSSSAHPSPSLSCQHIILLYSIHAHTTSTYSFLHDVGYFSHLRRLYIILSSVFYIANLVTHLTHTLRTKDALKDLLRSFRGYRTLFGASGDPYKECLKGPHATVL